MDSLAKTSLLTAAMRAKESNRSANEGRLFTDPYAEILAGTEGMALLARALLESGDQPAIAVRTFYMDEKISTAVNQGVHQIVILAAGMDTRAYRLNFPEKVKIFELDKKEVLAYKQEKLGNAQLHCDRIPLAIDLHDDWTTNLLRSSFKIGTQSLWLIEGLLMYLEENQIVTLFEKINSVAKTNDIMLLDILSRTLLSSPFMKNQLQFLANMGAPWRFGVDEPELFMAKLGWNATVKQTGEAAPARWPFPVAPRSVPDLPRGFLIEAKKNE